MHGTHTTRVIHFFSSLTAPRIPTVQPYVCDRFRSVHSQTHFPNAFTRSHSIRPFSRSLAPLLLFSLARCILFSTPTRSPGRAPTPPHSWITGGQPGCSVAGAGDEGEAVAGRRHLLKKAAQSAAQLIVDGAPRNKTLSAKPERTSLYCVHSTKMKMRQLYHDFQKHTEQVSDIDGARPHTHTHLPLLLPTPPPSRMLPPLPRAPRPSP